MAAALFNREADPARARALSAGTSPAARVHPEVIEVMREIDIDLAGVTPRRLSDELTSGADLLITMGCGEACPLVPGLRRQEWPLPDPADRPLQQVRKIRDEIGTRVRALIDELGVGLGDQ